MNRTKFGMDAGKESETIFCNRGRGLLKTILAPVLAVFLSVSLVAAAIAGPAAVSGKSNTHQGTRNYKKAMVSMRERDKKVAEVRKKAQAKRAQAQGRK